VVGQQPIDVFITGTSGDVFLGQNLIDQRAV
jgi:hypothetical protein